MTANEAQKEIARLQAESTLAEQQIAELKNSAADWRRSKSQCAGTKSKRATCEAGKEAEAQAREAQIPAKQSQISRNAVLINDYRKLVDAEAQATIKLADHGLSAQSAIIKSEGEAKALQDSAQITARITAEAQAKAIQSTTDSANQVRTAFIIASVIVGIAIVWVVTKKIITKKPLKP